MSQRTLELLSLINGWGMARNITSGGGATALAQVSKLLEETAECIGTLNQMYVMHVPTMEGMEVWPSMTAEDHKFLNLRKQLADDYGDMLVCIVQAVRLSGLTIEECLEKAWEDIKDRRGTMVAGKFVKEVY